MSNISTLRNISDFKPKSKLAKFDMKNLDVYVKNKHLYKGADRLLVSIFERMNSFPPISYQYPSLDDICKYLRIPKLEMLDCIYTSHNHLLRKEYNFFLINQWNSLQYKNKKHGLSEKFIGIGDYLIKNEMDIIRVPLRSKETLLYEKNHLPLYHSTAKTNIDKRSWSMKNRNFVSRVDVPEMRRETFELIEKSRQLEKELTAAFEKSNSSTNK